MNQESRIQDLQSAHIKKIIKSVLILRPLPIDQIVRLVAQKTMPNMLVSKAEKKLVEQYTSELIFDGHLNAVNGKIELNMRYRVSSVEEDYKLEDEDKTPKKPLMIQGDYIFETVGSERYPFIWQKLEEGSTVEVELIAEPTNMRDALAVAVCIDKKPYAYLPRPEAAQYHAIIVEARNKNYAFFTKGKVAISESVLQHKIFILSLEQPESISRKINNI